MSTHASASLISCFGGEQVKSRQAYTVGRPSRASRFAQIGGTADSPSRSAHASIPDSVGGRTPSSRVGRYVDPTVSRNPSGSSSAATVSSK
ncbi:hypothetical protein BRD07_05865 [Halobacteriales archaeon QS_9_68_42]|nr:MAG: hypothetical protein BRD07_05865 [Halobacteriales archaeon QS_9_68_42]